VLFQKNEDANAKMGLILAAGWRRVALGGVPVPARAYVDTPPPTLGSLCSNTTYIVEMRVDKVNKGKNLVIFRKVRDLKDKYPTPSVKHSLNYYSSLPQDFTLKRVQEIVQQMTPGKTAILFSNGHTPDRKSWGCHVYTDACWYSCHWYPDEEQCLRASLKLIDYDPKRDLVERE
jgi:hypothetical protein